MTVIAQDDHLTAGAWADCASTNVSNYFCALWPTRHIELFTNVMEISQSSPGRFCKSFAYFHFANYRFSIRFVSFRKSQYSKIIMETFDS